MCSVSEKPTSDNLQSPLSRLMAGSDAPRRSPRQQKEILLPQITQMALEGHSGRAIARQVGLPKRTVNRWLHELRQEWTAKAAEGAGQMFNVELARLDAIYREAMQAWQLAKRS